MCPPIRVLIVDDSITSRMILRSALTRDPRLIVVGSASDPTTARDMILQLKPDVLTLDIEMPRMNGLQFLDKIMRLRPMPVVMVSAYTQHGADITIQALQMGAVECLAKPIAGEGWPELAHLPDLIVRAAAARPVRAIGSSAVAPAPSSPLNMPTDAHQPLIVIGSSTGGIEALTEILQHLPALCPPILITQHIASAFTASLARRLDQQSAPCVRVAVDQMPIESGHIYIAPGGEVHLEVARRGNVRFCALVAAPAECGHRPSADRLFRSAASACGRFAIGIILTGMGDDGARGLLDMRRSGARTIAQDRASSVVYGMPKSAIERGAVEFELPLSRIAPTFLTLARDLTEDNAPCV
ncbi:chemotaxis response regulator protein-glutamate methylesterase [Ameyamaea chiangmaiensis]|uniref:Protein-glutamate methylesterase/protein-glutamine glutaminase n=2 Tax=Ameyamaea chiangmaiensis TaxID=442969 RepID=A0A850P835_9PROT|nr:chemotaxis response regulator protein-glutamate methylesterase [Ameyamaea chiangmaiensis]MBS4076018.1 chemotaxis response regulator protein-glutamate methylesterase [Ameyamaea chiangmaiensis]NVN40114.1 chemotaxis response regulator protein-glutamate methylesterase [Ameyamaea chiangmaiensis]